MKNYKSELINKILEQRGHEKSALHYESECIETWINESKGAYPKLCDYQSEWLNYIKEVNGGGGVGGEEPKPEPPIGVFPYETVTTNNTATVNHVVPFEYKSAILKGQTLVNLCDLTNIVTTNKANVVDKTITIEPTGYIHIGLKSELSSSEIYTLMLKNFEGDTSTIQANLSNNSGSAWTGTVSKTTIVDNCVLRVIQPKQGETEFIIRIRNNGESKITFTPMFLIGEETIEQNYFEGLSSVKMPVLKTTNSNNLIDTNPNSWHIIDGKTQIIQNKPIKVQPNTKYSFFINSSIWGYIFKCDEFGNTSKQYIGNNKGGGSFVTDDDCYYIIARNDLTADVTKAHTKKMRLFQGTEDLGYTGYVDEVKSNILTVNEDIELRGIGDVCDELDLLTGKLTQRIGEDGEVLSQEVVKTVELSIVDQDGKTLSGIKPIEETMHVTVSGTPINPTAVLEVPVEAITQNLNSFIEE